MSKDKKRRKLYIVQKSCCFWCFKKLKMNETTLDHLMPRSKGGNNDISNLVIACEECNQSRRDLMINPFTKESFSDNPPKHPIKNLS